MRHLFTVVIFLALALVACTPSASPQEIAVSQGENIESGKPRFLLSYATW